MSPLWRDKLRIALSPDRVGVTRVARGLKPAVAETHTIPCDGAASGETPWAPALAGLEAGLDALRGKKADVDVVFSNHFVRYARVPWSDQIGSDEEEQEYIRHCFAETYGESAQHWALRVSPGGYGETRVASAVDQALLDSLERIAAARGLRLYSMQPYLMAAFNQWRRHLHGSTVWFVLAEPGRLCLSVLRAGRWYDVQTVKAGEEWPAALGRLLERELLVSESGMERGTVHLWAPGHAEPVTLPGWTVHSLDALPGAVPGSEFRFSANTSE